MIRKVFMLVIVIFLFIYIAWNFYAKALSYDPLSEMKIKQFRPRDAEITLLSKYNTAWTKEIYEKNLFSPYRSYIEQKAVPVSTMSVEPPQKRPELALKGIVLDLFGDYIAYIEIDNSKPIPMRKGDRAEDIELVDISARKVVLKWDTEIINLGMDKIKAINKPRTTK